MSLLVDHQIRDLCRHSGLVEPFDPGMVNTVSIDLAIDDAILIEGRICGPECERVRWREVNIGNGYILGPGQFILAHSVEMIRMPNWVDGSLSMKTTYSRNGLNLLSATTIDPGFMGKLTFELHNVNQRHSVEINSGLPLIELRFRKLDATPIQSYAFSGKYMNDVTVCPGKA